MKDATFLLLIGVFVGGLFYVSQLRYELGVQDGRLDMLQKSLCRPAPVPKKSSTDRFPFQNEILPPVETALGLRGAS